MLGIIFIIISITPFIVLGGLIKIIIFIDKNNNKCVITTKELAKKYGHLIDCIIYTPKK